MRQLTENQVMAILAQTMEGRAGDALRIFLTSKFGECLEATFAGDREYNAGRMSAVRDITNGLNAIPGVWKAMQEQEQK